MASEFFGRQRECRFLHSLLWKQNGGQCEWAYGEVNGLGDPVMLGICKPETDKTVVGRSSSDIYSQQIRGIHPMPFQCFNVSVTASMSSRQALYFDIAELTYMDAADSVPPTRKC